ncbi:hypothetical protein [Mucilaginibacter celer]|uniref:Uncharacterized protein n=1 Tax=Mucilaginibacter celer TaxID=2305508 RepID=A0A494VK85_9SPHI|nr:hypothetical protein [Mucilaginibacter celer]AYL94814.1 hypothetical protein HYN43_005635 [Mucilaginibacter celer]
MNIRKPALLLAFVIGTFTLNSCDKESDDVAANSTLSATVDGTNINFTNVVAVHAVVEGKSYTNIQGVANKDTLNITLPGNITTGKVYTSTAADDNDKVLAVYSTTTDDYVNDDTDPTKVVTVNITSAAVSAYQGTFKGNLTNIIGDDMGVAKHKVITNGKFNVKIN